MGVNLKALQDGSMGMEGVGLDTGAFLFMNIHYNTATPLAQSMSLFPRKMILQSIVATPDVASTNAVTATLFQAPSGTAIGTGTALHTGTVNVQGAAAVNQPMTLSTVAGATQVLAGSRIGIVISGALGAAGNGVITLAFTPA